MNGFFSQLANFLIDKPLLLVLIVFLAAAGDTLFVVGFFFPGTAIVMTIAAVAGATGHGLPLTFVAAVAGAIAGDAASYWIGHRYGAAITTWRPIAKRPGLMGAAQRFFARRGAWAIFVGRFTPGLRTVTAVAAALSGFSVFRFMLANVASAFAYAGFYVFSAALGGGLLAMIGGRVAAFGITLLIVLLVTGWLASLIFWRLAERSSVWRRRFHAWAAGRADRPSRLLGALIDPDRPHRLGILVLAAIGALALIGFVAIADGITDGEPIVQADLGLSRFVQLCRTPWLDDIMIVITMSGDATVMMVTVAAAALAIGYARRWRLLGLFAAAIALTSAAVPLIKTVIGRARPLTDLYTGADAFSFPSGHATNATVIVGLLSILVARAVPHGKRAVLVSGALLALLIGFSRIYLQAHWPSDVLAGLLFGGTIVLAFAVVTGPLSSRRTPPRAILLVPAIYLAVAGIHAAMSYQADKVAYAPRDLSVEMTEAAWRSGGWQRLAPGTIGLDGEIEVPFVGQWVGTDDAFARKLEAGGWSVATPWRLGALGRYLSGKTPLDQLPPSPEFHLGRPAAVTMTKPSAGGMTVLRLWASDYRLPTGPIFVLALSVETADRPLGLLTITDETEGAPSAVVTAVEDVFREDRSMIWTAR